MKKSRFRILNLRIWLFLCVWLMAFGLIVNAYALDLDNLRAYFLEGNYKTCIFEGEKILARAPSSNGLDELYYILGLSYLKDGNYLRASDIFEIILNEYRNSKFKDEANLGLGDSYFLRRDYTKAEDIYLELLKNRPRSKLKPAIYFRLSQLGKRTANNHKYEEFRSKLKSEFPQSPEALTPKEFLPGPESALPVIPKTPLPAAKTASPEKNIISPLKAEAVGPESDIISGSYSVQVGAFSSVDNARKLTLKLKAQGYSAFYISEAVSLNKKVYKVRVGGFSNRQEAQVAQTQLKVRGYPTKIIP
jgi:tetratricopeptide (TPR) repeat protein